MSGNIRLLCAMAATLAVAVVGHASDGRDNERDRPQTLVKDSTITSEIKARLAEQHGRSLARVHVDTDDHGVVKLSGRVHTQAEMDTAVAIARGFDGVRKVKNDLRIKQDD